jgi:hypothetical protein
MPAAMLRENANERRCLPPSVAIIAVVTGAVLTGLLLRSSPALCPNDMSRWNAVWAMVETGRCSWIGDKPFWTIDRCTFDTINTPEDGRKARWYSSKPYFMQVLLAGLAWPICRIGGLDFDGQFYIVGRLILILVNVVPLMLFLAFFGRLLVRLGVEGFTFAFCMAAAAAGTYMTAWCITLNNHVLAALCGFFSLYALFSAARDRNASGSRFALAGLLAGMAAAFETPATAILGLGAAYAVYVCLRDQRNAGLAFLAAAVVPVAAFFLCNRLCTGLWIPFQWTIPDYYDPYWLKPGGIDNIRESKLTYFFHLTLGHHGFFSLTPILLLSLVGMVLHLCDRTSPMRDVAAITLLTSVAVFGFNTIKTNNYGGTCQGARWLFFLVPLWLMMLPAGVERVARAAGRWLPCALLAVSAFSTAYAVHMPWSESWLHTLMRNAGWIDY